MINDEVWTTVGRRLTSTATWGVPGEVVSALELVWAEGDPTLVAVRDELVLDVAPLSAAAPAGARVEGPAELAAAVGQTVRGLGSQTTPDGRLGGLDLVLDGAVLSLRAAGGGLAATLTPR